VYRRDQSAAAKARRGNSGLFQTPVLASGNRNEKTGLDGHFPLVNKGFTASIEVTS
jgi:hypothetical protein